MTTDYTAEQEWEAWKAIVAEFEASTSMDFNNDRFANLFRFQRGLLYQWAQAWMANEIAHDKAEAAEKL